MLGLDNSLALLREAHKRDHRLELVHADARALSGMFRPNSFVRHNFAVLTAFR